MLRMPEEVFVSEEANGIVQRTLSRAFRDQMSYRGIASAVSNGIRPEGDQWHSILEENPTILNDKGMDDLFPAWMPVSKRLQTFCGLYSLLLSKEEFVPTIEMEYLLARLIRDASGSSEKIAILTKEEKKLLRAAAVEAVREMEVECADTEEKAEAIAAMQDEEFCVAYREQIEEKAQVCSRFTDDLLEFCFWDVDYELLDEVTPDGFFRKSEPGLEFGIVLGDEGDDRFFYPEKWWEEQGFCFARMKN